jgi:hypothetical protein
MAATLIGTKRQRAEADAALAAAAEAVRVADRRRELATAIAARPTALARLDQLAGKLDAYDRETKALFDERRRGRNRILVEMDEVEREADAGNAVARGELIRTADAGLLEELADAQNARHEAQEAGRQYRHQAQILLHDAAVLDDPRRERTKADEVKAKKMRADADTLLQAAKEADELARQGDRLVAEAEAACLRP